MKAYHEIPDTQLSSGYFIKPGYLERTNPEYCQDEVDSKYQPDVYAKALSLCQELGAGVLIDVGCGKAGKLKPFAQQGIETIGIDIGSNLIEAKEIATSTIEFDVEFGLPFISPTTLSNSVVVIADVIEHLKSPKTMLEDLRDWARLAKAILISTPDRDRTHGTEHNGPPPNTCHVREWNRDEFEQYLIHNGFSAEVGFTRAHESHDKGDLKTILAVIKNDQNS